jgi:O-antigen ligase
MYMLCATLGVVMSRARTGWLLLIVALSVAGFMKWQAQFPKRERVILAASFVMASVLMIVSTVGYYAQIALLLGKDSTLTGRTDVYKAILIEVVREPIWGYGYMAFFIGRGEWLNFALRSRFIGLGNAENPLLQVWLELGLIGVACLLVSLFQACRNAGLCLVNNPSGYTQWCIMMIFLNVAALLGGDKIMFPHTIEWLLYVIGYIGLSTEAQRIRNRAHEINSR